MNILKNIDKEVAKKIFSSKDNVEEYLSEFNKIKKIAIKTRKIKRGDDKGKETLDMDTKETWNLVISSWDYKIALKIIRDLFKKSEKYNNGKKAKDRYTELVKEWKTLNLGQIKWPCSQGAFDEFVQRVNNSSEPNKDKIVSEASIKYRRMKELNTIRNDFIEIMIFEKNKNILPTLKHTAGTDYFINGESFDQKVAKSPTDEFKNDYKDNWKEEAKEHPEVVAEYLYKYQDEGRFGADSRILIVYLDESIDLDKIEEIINNTDLENPLGVIFTYNHKDLGERQYKVKCFVIVLSN